MFWEIFFAILAALCVWSVRQYWGNIIGMLLGVGLILGVIGGLIWGAIALYQKFPEFWVYVIGMFFFGIMVLGVIGVVMGAYEQVTGLFKKPAAQPDESVKEII